jgi:hypothetical protein
LEIRKRMRCVMASDARIIHEPNYDLERMRCPIAFCIDRGADVGLFPPPVQPTTPRQIWNHLEHALEFSRNPNYWTFRDEFKRCQRVNDSSVDEDNGFSRWFWFNVPRLFHHAYVTPEGAPGIAACLLEVCENYSDLVRRTFRLHRRSGFVFTEADHRVLMRATLLTMMWTVGELSEGEHDEFDALGVHHDST